MLQSVIINLIFFLFLIFSFMEVGNYLDTEWKNFINTEYQADSRPTRRQLDSPSNPQKKKKKKAQNHVSMVVPVADTRIYSFLLRNSMIWGRTDPGSNPEKPVQQNGGASGHSVRVRAPVAGTGRLGKEGGPTRAVATKFGCQLSFCATGAFCYSILHLGSFAGKWQERDWFYVELFHKIKRKLMS